MNQKWGHFIKKQTKTQTKQLPPPEHQKFS